MKKINLGYTESLSLRDNLNSWKKAKKTRVPLKGFFKDVLTSRFFSFTGHRPVELKIWRLGLVTPAVTSFT